MSFHLVFLDLCLNWLSTPAILQDIQVSNFVTLVETAMLALSVFIHLFISIFIFYSEVLQ